MIFRVCLIIFDAIVLAITPSKTAKILFVFAIAIMSISFLGA
jgi:hypothetical protein